MFCVCSAGAAVFGEVELLGGVGLVTLGDVVKITALGAF